MAKTPQQKRAIEAPIDAHVVLEAVPGSGKTFVIERRLDHLVQNGVNPDNILVVTFSRSQAEDMGLRIFSTFPYLAETSLRTGLGGNGQVTTIHAACWRMLKEYYPEFAARRVAKSWQSRSIIEKWVEKVGWLVENPRTRKLEPVGFNSILYWIDEAKRDFIRWEHDALYHYFDEQVGDYWAPNLTRAALHYRHEMQRDNLVDFADMMYEAEYAFTYDEGFRTYWQQRFTHLLIDEAQDTSAQAMRIVEKLHPKAAFIVGDSDQTLYRFNGAAPEFNLRDGFDRIFGGQRFNMTVNFRSHPGLLKRAASLIIHNYDEETRKYGKTIEAWEEAMPGPDLTWAWFEDPEEEAWEIAREIEAELLSEDGKPGDYFVMGRVNAQMAYIELEFLRRGIPFVNLGNMSFFNRRIPKIVTSYMRLAVNPVDWDAYDYVYNIASVRMTKRDGSYCPTRYLGAEFNARLDRAQPVIAQLRAHRFDENRKGWAQWKNGATDLIETLEHLQFSPGNSALVFIQELRKFVLDAWIEAEYRAEDDEAGSGEIESVWDDLAVLEEIGSRLSVEDFFTYMGQLQAGKNVKPEDLVDYVLIGTIYRFKGLERPNTYIIGASDGVLPHRFSLGWTPPTDGIPRPSKSTVWDERNVMYVAVTRAKRRCRVSGVAQWPGQKEPLLPSRFVYEMDLMSREVEYGLEPSTEE